MRSRRVVVGRLWPGGWSAGAAAIAAVVVLFGSHGAQRVQTTPRVLDAGGYALALVAALALAWWARFPRAVLAVVVAAVCGYLAAGYPYGPVQVCVVVAIFVVGRRCALRASIPACVLAAVAVGVALYPRQANNAAIHSPTILVVLWAASWLVVPWSIGALLQAGATTISLRRKQLLDEAVWSERMRLARDVHDVAGHGFAVVAMQAGVAMLTAEERPEQAMASLQAIHTTSTRALAELRTTLGVFGADPPLGGSPQLGPPRPGPGADLLVRLAELADGMRSAGVEVTLEFDSRIEGVLGGAEIDEAIYRIVQESLTNVVRHAAAAPTTVTLGVDGDDLTVTVADLGPGSGSGEPPESSGQGIRGMRDRLHVLGGSLSVDSSPGGFTVSARFPLSDVGSAAQK